MHVLILVYYYDYIEPWNNNSVAIGRHVPIGRSANGVLCKAGYGRI